MIVFMSSILFWMVFDPQPTQRPCKLAHKVGTLFLGSKGLETFRPATQETIQVDGIIMLGHMSPEGRKFFELLEDRKPITHAMSKIGPAVFESSGVVGLDILEMDRDDAVCPSPQPIQRSAARSQDPAEVCFPIHLRRSVEQNVHWNKSIFDRNKLKIVIVPGEVESLTSNFFVQYLQSYRHRSPSCMVGRPVFGSEPRRDHSVDAKRATDRNRLFEIAFEKVDAEVPLRHNKTALVEEPSKRNRIFIVSKETFDTVVSV
nr:hypothetical protein [Rhizobium laguerreae]